MPTVKELKAKLRRYGLPVSGVKRVLIERIDQARREERYKRVRRGLETNRIPALAGEELPNENDEVRAEIRKLNDEIEASLLAVGYEKRLRKNPTLQIKARRRRIVRAIARAIADEGQFYQTKGRGQLRDYRINVPRRLQHDVHVCIEGLTPKIMDLVRRELNRAQPNGIKINVCLSVEFEKEGVQAEHVAYLHSGGIPITNLNEIRDTLDAVKEMIIRRFEQYCKDGSGLQLKRCTILDVHISEYQPFRGNSWFPTPASIPPRCTINVKNEDNRCFEWAILSALYPVEKDAQRPSKYRDHLGELNFDRIEFPMKTGNIRKFERQNPNISVSVFKWSGKYLIPEVISNEDRPHQIDLLLISDGEKSHYIWIKDLARMLFKNSKHGHRQYPCRRCLHVYSSETLLKSHTKDCRGIGEKPQRIEMPKEGENTLMFAGYAKELRIPYVVYADFECLHVPLEVAAGNNTKLVAKQTPCSYCYAIVRCDGQVSPPKIYRGERTVENFLSALEDELEEIIEKKPSKDGKKVYYAFKNQTKPHMTKDDWSNFNKAEKCLLCNKSFDKADDNYKTRNNCPITGKYRGAAHKKCRINPQVPVVFHNLRGYDSHLLMQAIGTASEKRVTCIPNNMEKYMSVTLGQLKFIDSLQFLNASLSKLVENMKEFPITSSKTQVEHLDLLKRKGVYPYEYVNSFERFNETRLPPKQAFYSSLAREDISHDDYRHAKKVWNTIGCNTFGDYHDIYLKTDVLLLADVFETFRNTSMQHYGLDPAHYISAPGMSWDAMLKIANVKLELLTDIDQHLFIEKGKRGGLSMVSKRFAKANNPLVGPVDPSLPTSWLIYLDANNLYGWAMCQPLPTGRFTWVERTLEDILAIPEDAPIGCYVEVDLEYPEDLHDAHSDYPLAPETMAVPRELLGEYQMNLVNELGGKYTESIKLVPHLLTRKQYVCHYRNLQLYVSLGMKVTKIHRVLEFQQSAWMAPYINLNTKLRAKATSDFEKNFFKLMNNSVFGKTMENLRKRIRVDLVRQEGEEERLRRLIADPAFISRTIFDGNLVAVHSAKSRLKLHRPIYAGMAILDLSKHLMYDFWYKYIKARYGAKAQLCYTDTDSLIIQVETEDIYADMKTNDDLYDFSDYPKDHRCYSNNNKKVVGKFKDECEGTPIAEFVGLKPKMYSILRAGGEEIRKAKGVTKAVVKKDLRHDLYKQCLNERKQMVHQQVALRSRKHQIGLYEQNKISLSPMDTKKWIAPDGVTTRAHGHHATKRDELALAEAYLNEILGE